MFGRKKKETVQFVDGINEPMGGKRTETQVQEATEIVEKLTEELTGELTGEQSAAEEEKDQADPLPEAPEEGAAEDAGESADSLQDAAQPEDAGEPDAEPAPGDEIEEPGFFAPLPEGEEAADGKRKKKKKGRKGHASYLEEIPENEMDERDEARIKRMKRRKKELRRVRVRFALLLLLCLAGVAAGGYIYLLSQGIDAAEEIRNSSFVTGAGAFIDRIRSGELFSLPGNRGEEEQTETETEAAQLSEEELAAIAESERLEAERNAQSEAQARAEEELRAAQETLNQADLLAAQYDYDKAIALLQSQDGYDSNETLKAKADEIQAVKAACVEVSPESVVHVFVHSLIVDPARAFDGDGNERGYNLNMVTVEEFRKIIQSMYDNGYVLVSLHDMGAIDENGKMQRKTFLLPEGKKPLIFSQDDVSYYHSYKNDGFADKLLVDENGEVKNQYTDADGAVSIGDYDMVPILDSFIKEHPDFSYHGRKGIVVLTGYNGVFGYRTDADYRERASLQENQRAWLEANPDFDIDADIAQAKQVADAMKANGWEFASHTWGHISVSDVDYEHLERDTQRWHDNVENIVGDTDMIIFAFGSDIGTWEGYSEDNEKYRLLKDAGFDYFCNVDGSTLSWVQFGDTYLRTGRMNVDGYRMASNPEILAPLFDVEAVYDYANRPEMSEWSQ